MTAQQQLSTPKLVGTAHSEACLEKIKLQEDLHCDLIELRLDSLDEKTLSQSPLDTHPLLITARDPAEGGQNNLTLEARIKKLLQHLPHAAAIDLEWRNHNQPQSQELIDQLNDNNILHIASLHHFDHTPPADQLQEVINKAAQSSQPPDLFKIATRLNTNQDIITLLSLLEQPPLPLALMGMGPLGPASRIILTAAGSKLIYGYLHHSNAPGQLSAQTLQQIRTSWQPSQPNTEQS